jgi:hypothetical protein
MPIIGTSPSDPETAAYKVIGHSESIFFRTIGCIPIIGGIPSGIFEAVTAYRERKQDATPIPVQEPEWVWGFKEPLGDFSSVRHIL